MPLMLLGMNPDLKFSTPQERKVTTWSVKGIVVVVAYSLTILPFSGFLKR